MMNITNIVSFFNKIDVKTIFDHVNISTRDKFIASIAVCSLFGILAYKVIDKNKHFYEAYKTNNTFFINFWNLLGGNLQRALFSACLEGNLETAQRLVERGAKVDAQTANGETCLHLACRTSNTALTKFLLDKNHLLLEIPEKINGYTPLHVACIYGHFPTVQLLVERNANIDASANGMLSPLYFANRHKHSHIIEYLQQHRKPTPQEPCHMTLEEQKQCRTLGIPNETDANIQQKIQQNISVTGYEVKVKTIRYDFTFLPKKVPTRLIELKITNMKSFRIFLKKISQLFHMQKGRQDRFQSNVSGHSNMYDAILGCEDGEVGIDDLKNNNDKGITFQLYISLDLKYIVFKPKTNSCTIL